jgi:hypothetical protein
MDACAGRWSQQPVPKTTKQLISLEFFEASLVRRPRNTVDSGRFEGLVTVDVTPVAT